MAEIRSYLLIVALAAAVAAPLPGARKFLPGDPIATDPKPLPVGKVTKMKIDALYDFFAQSMNADPRPASPAQGINTLGEVPDSAWFTNRHARKRFSRAELQAGAGIDQRPVPPFELIGAKTDGITPGFRMRDSRGHVYFVKPDPVSNPEMATAADVIVSRFFYAIGYETPQNYILNLHEEQLKFSQRATVVGLNGKPRPIGRRDLDKILNNVPYRKDRSIRVVASLGVPGQPIGPFRYEGVRTDDPNDDVPHQNRRDLRGLRVFCAWLNHTDAKAQNTLDAIVERDGVRFIQHYLIDFGSTLGSDSDMPKNARFGNEFVIPKGRDALAKMFTFGFISPGWERAKYPKDREAGRIEASVFDPLQWKSNYPNPAFLSALPDDEYWAAKIVMSFTDEDIRALVQTGEFSNPGVADYLARTLAARRDKIGRVYFDRVLPLDSFRVSEGELKYEDLAVTNKFRQPRPLQVTWSRFDNDNDKHHPLAGSTGFQVPAAVVSSPAGSYFAARIVDPASPSKSVTVYVRGADVVGIDRTW